MRHVSRQTTHTFTTKVPRICNFAIASRFTTIPASLKERENISALPRALNARAADLSFIQAAYVNLPDLFEDFETRHFRRSGIERSNGLPDGRESFLVPTLWLIACKLLGLWQLQLQPPCAVILAHQLA